MSLMMLAYLLVLTLLLLEGEFFSTCYLFLLSLLDYQRPQRPNWPPRWGPLPAPLVPRPPWPPLYCPSHLLFAGLWVGHLQLLYSYALRATGQLAIAGVATGFGAAGGAVGFVVGAAEGAEGGRPQPSPLIRRLVRSTAFFHLHHQPSGRQPRGVRCEMDAVAGPDACHVPERRTQPNQRSLEF
jgi:hypothetical protein